jgi:hypothetical protein
MVEVGAGGVVGVGIVVVSARPVVVGLEVRTLTYANMETWKSQRM